MPTLEAHFGPVAQAIEPHLRDGETVYAVGGAVRDVLSGRPLTDIDLVTSDDPRRLATSIAAGEWLKPGRGTAFPLGEDFGCWRIAWHDGSHLDICPLRDGSIEADVRQRDFTVNALAVTVAADRRRAAGGSQPLELVDLVGGREDLEHRRLSAVSDTVFTDDPLRTIRAVRLAHVHGLDITDHTRDLIARDAHLIERPSGERILQEMSQILLCREVRRALRLADDVGLIDSLIPELAACREIEQSRFHHLDVFEHTLAVIDNCEDILASPGHYLGHPGDMPAEPFSDESRLTTMLAALCHDLAKPLVRRVSPDSGRVSFVGHDRDGVAVAAGICERWRTSAKVRDGVALLVRTHLDLGMLLHRTVDARERYRFLRRVEPWAAEAIVLSVADRLATAGVDDRRRWVRRHIELARRLWGGHWREQAHGHPPPLLDGMAIADHLGIAPGPLLGTAVAALAEAQAIGEVIDLGQAHRFLTDWATAHS